jgi:hypothetical protein
MEEKVIAVEEEEQEGELVSMPDKTMSMGDNF